MLFCEGGVIFRGGVFSGAANFDRLKAKGLRLISEVEQKLTGKQMRRQMLPKLKQTNMDGPNAVCLCSVGWPMAVRGVSRCSMEAFKEKFASSTS